MTDRAFEPPTDNPFEQFNPDKVGTLAAKGDPALAENPFAKHNPFPEEDPRPAAPKTSTGSAFLHGVERGVLPAIGSLPAIGAGAEIGATVGAFGGPFAWATVPAGALIGGLAGGLIGGTALSAAQDWALHQLPDSWRDALGQDDRTQRLEEAQHPTAAFLGGLTPYAVTMRPGAFTTTALPENATALQRIMAHPATARVFGGGLMGGMELGQEAVHGESPDWSKIAISTGFGVVFNKPTRLGERLIETGATPVRESRVAAAARERLEARTGVASVPAPETPEAAPATRPEPTIAQAADTRVMGPGITEEVFQGAHEQAPAAALTAQETARQEQTLLRPSVPEPDIHAVARRFDPDTLDRYDELSTQRETFRHWIEEAGGEAVPAAQAHLAATEAELHELAPQVAAAYRRAADATGGHTVEPEVPIGTFRTAKGSSYEIHEDGTTTRNKAYRPEHGEAEQGLMPRSEATFFVTPEQADALSLIQTQGEDKVLLPLGDGRWGVKYTSGPSAGKFERRSVITPSRTPAIGLLPVETWKSGKSVHFGNEITEVGPKVSRETLEAPTRVPETGERVPENEPAVPPSAPTGEGEAGRIPESPPIAAQRAAITNDVRSQLIHAGRGPEEAEAAAQLIAARYAARAAWFKGALGTAQELYEKEGAAIRGPRGTATAPVVEPPKGPMTPQELAEFIRGGGKVEGASKEFAQEKNPQTETSEFKKWFGESKAVGPDGDPQIFYHGTKSDFDAFMRVEGGNQYGGGFYFTSSPEQASRYATGDVNRISPQGNAGPNVVSVYLKYDKPYNRRELISKDEVEALETAANKLESGQWKSGELWRQFDKSYPPNGDNVAYQLSSTDAEMAVRIIRNAGFDAMVEPGMTVVFEPTQIKSAIGNRGTFDPTNARILDQTARGKIRLAADQRSVITLLKDANASTFIHETGHDFLEQLMRDSQHPLAPAALRDDATTVIDWLGVHSAEDIKTRQHEKFARGFEQYIREGIAPSPELVSVFAKFKSWLMNIYQTLKGLGQPISDDIRRVFDRMLSTEPQRTVIAPGREPGTTLGGLHAADAASIEPHEAAAHADLIAAERDRYIQEPPPRIAHEIEPAVAQVETARAEAAAARAGTEPGAEAGEGAGRSSEVEPGGGGAGVEPGSGGVGAGRGAERGSGGRAATEGAGGAGRERSRSELAKGIGDQPLAAHPAELFGPSESPFVDKAGNIRLDNINTPEQVKQAMRDAADANNDFIGDRRGVVTDGQVMEFAEALGMDFNQLSTRKIGQAFNAEQIKAAEKLLSEASRGAAAAMQKAATGTDADVIAYAQAKSRFHMIQGQFSGITAEAGRAFRALQRTQELWSPETTAANEFLKGATGKTLFQLKMEAKLGAQLDTPAKVARYLNDARKRSFGGMILEYWINNLISGPTTHMTYMMGNELFLLLKATAETGAAALIGSARRSMGREGPRHYMGEIGAQLAAHVSEVPAALQAGVEAMRSGVTTLLPGERARPNIPFSGDSQLVIGRNATNDPVTWGELSGTIFSVMRGVKDGLMASSALIKAGGIEGAPLLGAHYSPLGQIPDFAIRGVRILPGIVPGGTQQRLPGRGVATIHSFFRSTNYSMDIAGIAHRTAMEEGLEGNAFARRVAEIRQNPTEAQMEEARTGSTERTLMADGGKFVRNLSKFLNTTITLPGLGEFRPLKFIDPFVHIGANIINQSIVKRSPIGLLSKELRADLMGHNGNIAQDMAQARMLVGTLLSIAMGGLAMGGYASGSGPKDPKESAMWRLAGNQAHSVRIGDTWYDVHKLGPLGLMLGIAADMYEVAHLANEGEFIEAAAHFHHGIVHNILDESFMRGPSDLIKAIEDPGRYGDAYVRNFLASFVPFSVGMQQIARAADPYSRQTRTLVDAIKNKIPGLSQTLLPRRDIWGEPMPNHSALLAPGVTAIYETKMSTDPVNMAMLDIGINPAQPQRKIRNVELTDEQYDDFARIAGRMTKMRLDQIVRSPTYQTWPNHIRHDVIQATINQSREAARGMMLMKYPQIVKDAVAEKLERIRGD